VRVAKFHIVSPTETIEPVDRELTAQNFDSRQGRPDCPRLFSGGVERHFGSRESTETCIMAQSQAHVSPAQLAHYLKGIEFPASKRDLKADARKNQAPPEILKFIDELPEEQYRTMAEVMKAVGELE
jgi:Protein of unknown function (DUF2795)